MRSARHLLERRGFLEVLSPVFEPFTDTGVGDAGFFEIDYYGKTYKLMSALTVHKPLLVTQLGNIFSFTPCSRKEPIDDTSRRHLSQFYQIEVELEGDYEKAISLLERLTKHIIDRTSISCKQELELLRRNLPNPILPFRRMTYRDALDTAKDLGIGVSAAAGMSWAAEEELSRHFKTPFFITGFPTSLSDQRGILYKTDGDNLLDFDLIMPEGHGEVSSGSERESQYHKIIAKLKPDQMESFGPYLDLIRSGLKGTSGFGIGVERLTKYLCGLDDVSEASFFPKIPGVA